MKIGNKTKAVLLFVFCFLLISSYYFFIHSKQMNNSAVFDFNDERYKESSEIFRKLANEKKGNFTFTYNYASSLYKLNDLDESLVLYNRLLDYKDVNNTDKAGIYYNIRNIYFLKDEYNLAIENYKAALLLNPEDEEIKYNIE